jgi:Prokaryotic membrane lipoprotein lipid attachment site
MMRRILAIAGLAAVLAGCSSGGNSLPSGPGGTFTSGTPSPSSAAVTLPAWETSLQHQPYHPKIVPSSFTTRVTNTYFPLVPGTTFVFTGAKDSSPVRNEVTVTKETKRILGVRCVVVRDIVTTAGSLSEKTTDWYAQDKAGNVWYFGEDTKEYVNGAVSSTAGTWMGGVNGAIPGIVMPASPKAGDAYRQEYRPGQAEDVAKILRTNGTFRVGSKTYRNVIVTHDLDPLNRFKNEHKRYAPGVGFVGVDGMVNGHHETLALVSVSRAV